MDTKIPTGETLITSTRQEYDYQDYVESYEANGLQPKGEDSHDFSKWCHEHARNDYDEAIAGLKANPKLSRPFFIKGTISRWNGSFGVTIIMSSFTEAYDKCIGNDTLDVDLGRDEQSLLLDCHHHDATNRFRLWPLRDDIDLEEVQDLIDDRRFNPLEAKIRDRYIAPLDLTEE